MNKNELQLGDSAETHQDGLITPVNSLISPNVSVSSCRSQRNEQCTMTDQMICNCACDTIPKLKEKAHKSFMQVIQIENLYKEEIIELKKHYEECLKTKDKKSKIKEDLLAERCKELESEMEKMKQYNKSIRQHELQDSIESPFNLENIENIAASPLPDESTWSIYNIREFVQTPNLKDNSKRLENDLANLISKLKKQKQRASLESNVDGPQDLTPGVQEQIIRNIEGQVIKIFNFIQSMIENTVQAHQKYNALVLQTNQAEARIGKLNGLQEAGQKEAKFMSQHIKKISQEKIRIERKNNQLERTVKNQEESIKFLKKLIAQKEVKFSQSQKKDVDCLSSYNLRDNDVDPIITNSLLSTKIERKNNGMMTKSAQGPSDRILPRSLNFKKKTTGTDK